jgi:hypothetical protein
VNTPAENNLLVGWRTTCAAGIVAAALLSSCAPGPDTNEAHTLANVRTADLRAPDIYVDINHRIVTVRAHDAPLHTVIEKLANKGKLQVQTKERLDESVTVELQSLSLMAALQELLRGFSFVLVDARQTTDSRQDGRGTLWIFSRAPNQSGANVSVNFDRDSHEKARREEHESLEDLSAAITDHEPNTRLDAVSELGDYFDEAEAAPMLAGVALGDEHPAVRSEALHAIARTTADTRAAVFTRALTDRDASVRKAAIGALDTIGAENSVQTLAIALKDRDESVRATAVDTIGEIQSDDALRLLESALADESAVVREAAAEQLMQRPLSRKRR